MQKTKATLVDLLEASENLSPSDLADFDGMQAGRKPAEVFMKALDETTHVVKSGGGQVLAAGGHSEGGIWLITTTHVAELSTAERFKFYRILKAHLAQIKSQTPGDIALTNYVAVQNHAHLRLLTKLGAVLSDGLFKSPSGLLLKQFSF